jgi:hypothetical protein
VNPALVAFAGTITVLGSVADELLLDKLTVSPLVGAAAVSVTVHASVPAPVMTALLQESALNPAEPEPEPAVPVPLRATTGVALAEESVATVSCPVAVPAAAGLN